VTLDEVERISIAFARDDEGNFVVVLRGEVDVATTDEVRAALVEALMAWSGQVVVDLAGVSFLDSEGLATLIRVHDYYALDGRPLAVRAPQPQVRQLFESTGLDQIFRIED